MLEQIDTIWDFLTISFVFSVTPLGWIFWWIFLGGIQEIIKEYKNNE